MSLACNKLLPVWRACGLKGLDKEGQWDLVYHIDFVHTLPIGFVPKLFCFVMTCPHNMRIVPEFFVHIAVRTEQLKHSRNK